MTGCTCSQPGYCERHKVRKNAEWFRLCQKSEKYFAAWENGTGPGQRHPSRQQTAPLIGPGTELSRILGRFGLRDRPGCKCKSRAAQMDRWGADGCEKNFDMIVGWLREEAQQRHLPFVESAAKMVIRRAIRKARQRENTHGNHDST